jgi:TonB-linked SusC/RagA family outer membrane protein
MLLAAFLQVSAHTYSQQVTLNMKNAKLQQVFVEINRQTGFQFFYKDELLKKAGKVNIDITNGSMKDALELCFKNIPLSFSVVEKTIVVNDKITIAATTKSNVEQLQVITGRVTDSSNAPLEGATVTVKETNRIVLTDKDGKFSIEAQAGQTLLISYIGYGNETVKLGTSKDYNVKLIPGSQKMKSIALVYTGYQSLAKERSTGSFSTINNEDVNKKSLSMNVVDRLEGLVPGLSVNYGATNEKFMIRGLTTIQASRSPLIVVDGVPISDYSSVSTLINPQDVETITVLRDATAASIWGAAAANGVIVIETKKGKSSSQPQKIKLQFNAFTSFRGRPDLGYFNMMETSQFLQTSKEIFSATDYPWATVTNFIGATPIVPPHERIQYDLSRGLISASVAASKLDSLARYNNRDQINQYLTQPSMLVNNSLNFDGGSKFHSYYGSMAYTLDKNDKKTDLSRYQMNLRQNFIFSPAIKLDVITNIAYEKTKNFLLSDLPGTNSNYLPYAMFADEAGNPLSQAYLKRQEEFRATSEAQSLINLDYVPLNEAANTLNDKVNFSARVNAGLTIKLFRGLTYESRVQYQKASTDGYEYYNQNSYKVRDELPFFTKAGATAGAAPTYYLPKTGGHFITQNTSAVAWTVRNQLNFDRIFAQKHQVTAIAGTELRNNLNKGVLNYRRGYDFQTMTYSLYNEDSLAVRGVVAPVNYQPARTTNNVLNSRPVTYSEVEKRFVSAYANTAYTYNRKYTLNSSIRVDQSNLFGTDRSLQYKPIWSLGGAWNISKEAFFKSDKINNLNLRITHGLGGNAPNPGSGGPYDIVNAANVAYFSGLGTGYNVLYPRNEKIGWERTATTNVGVDFALFGNKLSGAVDVYKKNTTDLLGFQPADPTTGWSFAYNNLGNLENKGIEIQLNSSNIQKKKFKWNTDFTISYNENKIVSLKSALTATANTKVNSTFTEGYSAYGLFAYNYAGLDAAGNPVALKANGKDTARRSADFTLVDPLYMGTTQPLWYGGITNNLTYGQFTLSFLIVYNFGNVMRRDVNQFFTGRLSTNVPSYLAERWQKPGDELKTDVPRYTGNTAQNGLRLLNIYTQANRNVVSAAYAKLRDMTLNYEIPKTVASKMSMSECSIYAQVNNVMLWKNNDANIDPEYYNLSGGVRTGRMPAFYTIGFRTTFK